MADDGNYESFFQSEYDDDRLAPPMAMASPTSASTPSILPITTNHHQNPVESTSNINNPTDSTSSVTAPSHANVDNNVTTLHGTSIIDPTTATLPPAYRHSLSGGSESMMTDYIESLYDENSKGNELNGGASAAAAAVMTTNEADTTFGSFVGTTLPHGHGNTAAPSSMPASMMINNQEVRIPAWKNSHDDGDAAKSIDKTNDDAIPLSPPGVVVAVGNHDNIMATNDNNAFSHDDNNNNDALTLKTDNLDQKIQSATTNNNDDNNDDNDLGSWTSDDSDVIEIVSKPAGWVDKSGQTTSSVVVATTSSAMATGNNNNNNAAISGATASFHSRNQQMPSWMNNNTNTTNNNNNPISNVSSTSIMQYPATTMSQSIQYPMTGEMSRPMMNNQSNYPMQNHTMMGGYRPSSSAPQYPSTTTPSTAFGVPSYIDVPSNHPSTWANILPDTYFQDLRNRQSQTALPVASRPPRYKNLTLSLINVWEFTIDIDAPNNNNNMMHGGGGGGRGTVNAIKGLRAQIKKISREHVGHGGRKGAVFEKGSAGEGIVPDDPILRSAAAAASSGNGPEEGGKWRIPLGAYHSLVSYLTTDPTNYVNGIPMEQLRAATLGRERMDRTDFPSAKELVRRGVFPAVSSALAPYQRVGVEFVLDKEGRALLADEMGLGKTVQAIAAMSAYFEDWPLLVLCPSTARYHWELEFRNWLGPGSMKRMKKKMKEDGNDDKSDDDEKSGVKGQNVMEPLLYEHINVLTSGKDLIFPKRGTKIVIASFGLIVSLINSGRVTSGMFNAVIVDESHALKSNKTKRTKAVLPVLHAAERCLLLSGTPALARPSELWPQISVLGGRRKDGIIDETSGIFVDEAEFMSKYVLKGERGADEIGSKSKLAELHTLLTSTIMIRRMKCDILKNLPSKIREKAFINVDDEDTRHEFKFYLQMLRQGKGILGKLARQDRDTSVTDAAVVPRHSSWGDDVKKNKEVLHHLYNMTGRAKTARITKMLISWLSDSTKGKLCIFAHHLDVLNSIATGARLNNSEGSSRKFIRIDGSTSPKARQEQISTFQTNPSVRIALLGITAAGVAVTLTASSTVWFAELFWTPAIMIQAEDRCHRIGQQARVRCLYFIGRGTLDEVLWKLIEKKFRDLGEFVEGKEGMDIALERELEDDEEHEILKADVGTGSNKRKSQDDLEDFVDTDDVELAAEIDELCHEEEEMLKAKCEEEDDDPDSFEKEASSEDKRGNNASSSSARAGATETSVIELLDEDTDEKPSLTIAETRQLYLDSGVMAKVLLDPTVRFNKLRVYTVRYPGPSYGLIMVSYNGRVIVRSFNASRANHNWSKPEVGSIIVAINGLVIPHGAPFSKILQYMKNVMMRPPVTVTFAEDDEFTSMFIEDIVPNMPTKTKPDTQLSSATSNAGTPTSSTVNAPLPNAVPQPRSGVIELLDDD